MQVLTTTPLSPQVRPRPIDEPNLTACMQVLTTTPLSPHRFVIGQDEAKRALSVAVCDHYNFARRCLAEPALAETHHVKPNVLCSDRPVWADCL